MPLERIGERSAQLLVDGDRRVARRGRWRSCSSGSASATSARARRRRSPASSAASTRIAGARGARSSRSSRRRRRHRRERAARSSPSSATASSSRSCVAAGVNFAGPPNGRGRAPTARRSTGSPSCSPARSPLDDPRGGAGRDRGARRQGHGQRVEEDELRGGRARARARSWPRPSSSACRRSTRPGCATSWSTGPRPSDADWERSDHDVASRDRRDVRGGAVMADDSVIGKRFPGYDVPDRAGQDPGVRAGDDDAQPRLPRRPEPVIQPTWLIASGFWAPRRPRRTRWRRSTSTSPAAARRPGVRRSSARRRRPAT